jgi:uncharacterized NAD-dependent epimerase/dehydratase family protein
MLERHQKLAVYMDGTLGTFVGKMGDGILRYSPNPVVAVIDSAHAGKDVQEVTSSPRPCPVVATVGEAIFLGADVVVIGAATSGGYVPPEWYPGLDQAVEAGLSLINGMHERLTLRYPALRPGQWVWDVRVEPEGLGVAEGLPAKLPNKRLLMVGTDMGIGKMTAGLEIYRSALERGVQAEFVATGQVGIIITGRGVPIDAVRVDFACGAVEREVLRCKDADLVIVEGQGSLLNPAASANLSLTRGTMPTHLILCHAAGKTTLKRYDWIAIPDLRKLLTLHEDLAEACGVFGRPKSVGVALNTSHLGEAEAWAAIRRVEAETGLPCTDPVRFGADLFVDRLQIGPG